MTFDHEDLAVLAEMVVDCVLERLDGRIQPGRLLTAAEVADFLAVEPAYVYGHWRELGGRKLPGGPKGRLRFSLEGLEKATNPGVTGEGAREPERLEHSVSRQRRRADSARRAEMGAIPLLPIRGQRPPEAA